MEEMAQAEHEYEYEKEILDYDGYVLSFEWEDHYMLTNDDSIVNPDEIEAGKTVAFDMGEHFVDTGEIID